jgi:4-amino-4-deoxy-L-arabinose transferase-like glycosyltransferase
MAGRIHDPARMMANSTENKNNRFKSHPDLSVYVIILLGFLARLWTASGIFLNPDEALHFRLANQPSLFLAYKASLTASHPPLLTLVLYFWRAFGTSELWLRTPSVLAGTAFCWMFYKWLTKAAGKTAGVIGLLFVALLPPIVLLGVEIRQYALLLAFSASALYHLDEAFSKRSSGRMVVFTLCLYLAVLSHYSAFLFAAALGIYALFRIVRERAPLGVTAAWTAGQLGAVAIAFVLYKTHISKLGVGESRTVLQGWMSEFFLRHSYFDRAHDNPVVFVLGHTFGVFQYFFGQLAVGDVMGLLFLVGVALLVRGEGPLQERRSSRRLGFFLALPFAIAAVASLADIYPYGGTRHIAFLVIPGMAGISVAIARFAGTWVRGLAFASVILIACIALGRPRQPRMERADQSRKNMSAAMQFVKQDIHPPDLIFVDYQTDLILGHYLCEQRVISPEAAPANFEQFSCDGHRVVSTDYKSDWMFWADNFPKDWQQFVQAYNLKPGETVWIFQTGWGVALPEDLRKHYGEFRDLPFQSFGKNIKIFQMPVGRPMPATTQ